MVKDDPIQTLINDIHARGWHGVSQGVLDVIEPVAPIIAQLLLVIQPVSGIFGKEKLVSELVKTLDSPDGIALLREQLRVSDTNKQE